MNNISVGGGNADPTTLVPGGDGGKVSLEMGAKINSVTVNAGTTSGALIPFPIDINGGTGDTGPGNPGTITFIP